LPQKVSTSFVGEDWVTKRQLRRFAAARRPLAGGGQMRETLE
jgi:hypothetical protein